MTPATAPNTAHTPSRTASIRQATPAEEATWSDLLAATATGGDPLQTLTFAGIKRGAGWRPHALVFEPGTGEAYPFVALSRPVALLGTAWYIPNGPGLDTAAQLQSFAHVAKHWFLKRRGFLLTMDSLLPQHSLTPEDARAAGLIKRSALQPGSAHTILLDLTPGETAVYASFKSTCRNNISRATREGVTAEAVPCTEENMRSMYHLLEETGSTAGYRPRTYAYHRALWLAFAELGNGQLFLAKHEDRVVAGLYMITHAKTGYYKDGGSVRERPVRGASHLLQWTAITWLMNQPGITTYDFIGSPPSDQIGNPEHPLHGLGRFKTQFSQVVADRLGSYEIHLRPRAVRLWHRAGYRIVNGLTRRLTGEQFY